VMIESMP